MKKLAFILVALALPLQSFAWGHVGHRTVGIIAQDHLSVKARYEVAKLLGKDTLGDVANWADSIKGTGKYKQTTWYHFEDVADNTSYLQTLQAMTTQQRRHGGVVEAILHSMNLLADQKTTLEDKQVALKFLAHFVGDIHQPLHSGRPEDKGGLTIQVSWFGDLMNLHGVWDSAMIRTGHQDLFPALSAKDDDDGAVPNYDNSPAYAALLEQKFAGSTFNTAMDVEGWLNESIAMRPPIYDPIYNSDQLRYQSIHLAEIDQRIYVAGLRLATMLNDLYEGRGIPQNEIDFERNVEAVVGPISSVISYAP